MKNIKIKKILSYLCIFTMLCGIFPMFSIVNAEAVDDIYFNVNYVQIMKDEEYSLKLTGSELDGVTFETEDEDVATISANGTVLGIAEGKTEVSAIKGDLKATCVVVVKEPIESGIRLNKSYLIGKQNDTFLLTVEAAEDIDTSEITWSSSNTSVATVDEDGLVKIVLENNRNKATITATAEGGETASCDVFVHNNTYKAISTYTHFFGNKNDSEQLLQYMYSTNGGESFTHYSQYIGDAWLDTGAGTGRVQNFRMQGKSGYWATIAFKAPYTGTLGIYYNGGCTTDGDVKFKILHNSNKIYPYEANKEYITVSASTTDTNYVTSVNGTLCLKDLTLDDPTEYTDEWADGVKVNVTEGDYIYLMATSEGKSMIAYTRGFEFKYDNYESDEIDICSVDISLTDSELECGDEVMLTSSYAGDEIVYFSADESVATVDESGRIAAVSEGETRIYAIVDETVADFCDITVVPKRSILMNKRYVLMGLDETLKMKAAYYPITELEEFEWSSSDESIAEVDGEGNVTAISEGVAVITATKDDKKADCIVEVTNKSEYLSLSHNNIWIEKGKTFAVSAVAAEEYANEKIVWTTENADIASVDKNGIVSGVGVGVTKISAYFENSTDIYAQCSVAVGTMDQFSLFSGTDNTDTALWQYGYMAEGGTEYTKFTSGTGSRWTNSVTFVQAADISFVAGSDTVRMFRAPATGKIKVTVKSGNTITNSATSGPAKAEFSLNFRGEKVKSFMFESQPKSDTEYYASTSYDGALTPSATSSTAYASDVNFKDELGTVTLDVCRGEYIYLSYKGITGKGHVSHYNGGICFEYESLDDNTEVFAGYDELDLTNGSIYELENIEDGALVYSSDDNVVLVNEKGSIKTTGTGEAVVYIANADASMMDYIKVNVTSGGLQADTPEYNADTQKVTVAVENLGSVAETVMAVAITRDAYGRPITVYTSEETTIASSNETIIEINNVAKGEASKLEIFVWECGDGIVPVRPSETVEFTG